MKETEIVNGYKIIHVSPDMTEEEKDEKRQEIARQVYYLFFKKDKSIATKIDSKKIKKAI